MCKQIVIVAPNTRITLPRGNFKTAFASEMGIKFEAYRNYKDHDLAIEIVKYWSLTGQWILSASEVINRFRVQLILPSVFRDYKMEVKVGYENLGHLAKIQEWSSLYRRCTLRYGIPANLKDLEGMICSLSYCNMSTPVQKKFLLTEPRATHLAIFLPNTFSELFNPTLARARELKIC